MLREFCDFRRGKCERQCGFGILRVESAKAVENLGIFRGKCEMLTETWDFLRGKYEMPCGDFDFLSRKDENPIRLCNLEFSRSKIALAYVPNRCAISGIRRRGGYI